MARMLIIPMVLLALLGGAVLWSGGRPEPKADFTFINRGDIRTLDPNRMSWMEDIRIGYAIYEGLYTLDPVTLDAIPGTAFPIDISDDKIVYTFHLRRTARWSNGDPVLAGDFVFAWRRMLEQPGDYTYLLDYIKGAEPYRKAFEEYHNELAAAREKAAADARKAGLAPPALVKIDRERPDFRSVGIEKIDDRTLRVVLNHPVTFFPDLCAFPPYFPLNEKVMKEFEEKHPETGRVIYDKRFMVPPNLITNGPFYLQKWEFKKRLRLAANPHYWDTENVKSRIIDQLIIEENKLGEFQRYETGAVDWLADIAPEIAAEMIAAGKRDPSRQRNDLKVFPAFGTYFYSVNCEAKLKDGQANPFHDVRVRKAFAMSLRKQEIVDTITRLGEQPALHYVPQDVFPGYTAPKGQEFDLEKARTLLAEAGYPGGKGFPRVQLVFNTGSIHGEIAQRVRRQWLEGLGVDLALEPVEPAIFSHRLHNQEYAIARASWFGDYNDVSTFTDKYLSNSDNNDSKWSNAEYDQLCRDAAREPDPARRLKMLEKAEAILLDEVPIIPVYYYVNKYMLRDNVKGIHLHARNMVMFKHVEVQR